MQLAVLQQSASLWRWLWNYTPLTPMEQMWGALRTPSEAGTVEADKSINTYPCQSGDIYFWPSRRKREKPLRFGDCIRQTPRRLCSLYNFKAQKVIYSLTESLFWQVGDVWRLMEDSVPGALQHKQVKSQEQSNEYSTRQWELGKTQNSTEQTSN